MTDPLLTITEVCAHLASVGRPIGESTWRAHVATGRAPKAENYVIERGHARPRWRKSVIVAWAPGAADRPPQPAEPPADE